MTKSVWNKRGEAILKRDGTLHHPSSKEGKKTSRRVYGDNSDQIEESGSIYDEDGGFYLDG